MQIEKPYSRFYMFLSLIKIWITVFKLKHCGTFLREWPYLKLLYGAPEVPFKEVQRTIIAADAVFMGKLLPTYLLIFIKLFIC